MLNLNIDNLQELNSMYMVDILCKIIIPVAILLKIIMLVKIGVLCLMSEGIEVIFVETEAEISAIKEVVEVECRPSSNSIKRI